MKKIIILLFVSQILGYNIYAQENLSNFDAIIIEAPFPVEITIGKESSIDLSAVKDFRDEIKFKNQAGVLHLIVKKRLSPEQNLDHSVIKIQTPNLSSITNRGAGNLIVRGIIKTNDLIVKAQASGAISANVQAKRFTGQISGSGSLEIAGTTTNASLRITGSGQFQGKNFTVDDVDVFISSSGNVMLQANRSITARLSASGSLIYSGDATISNKRYTASGRIIKQ